MWFLLLLECGTNRRWSDNIMDRFMNKLEPIPDFPNYKVNRKGQIWSDYYGGNFLKTTIHKNGYVRVYLVNKKGKSKNLAVHRIVAMTFIPNPNNLPQVHHLNAMRDDNNVYNLAWVSAQDNMKERHARRRKIRNDRRKRENNNTNK